MGALVEVAATGRRSAAAAVESVVGGSDGIL